MTPSRQVKLSPLQLRANQRLKDTQNTAALLSTFQEVRSTCDVLDVANSLFLSTLLISIVQCDVSALLAMQKDLGPAFEKTHKVKLGFLSAFVKASALALQAVPAVNAAIDMDNKDIVYHDYADINVVVATEKGYVSAVMVVALISPVVRNCESISLVDIERSLATLGAQVAVGHLHPLTSVSGRLKMAPLPWKTLRGAPLPSQTVTSRYPSTTSMSLLMASQGSLLSTNMLLSPHAAILSLHGIQNRPVYHDGKVVSRPMMYLSLSYDHRLIDGREGVTFLKTVADLVSDPRRMLLHV
ncbi:hypothetical protein DYB32_006127 [Aphanomyces invadans]|uniref:dihydrolipoyllysine-residue succinyltransferase n=1 Tax=Aphanomyces invadans TaxID=157072 RepID=A0A418AS81_9STRA|nr:hypothetical protein DYB32_006127 [Aphanomyces invadans]